MLLLCLNLSCLGCVYNCGDSVSIPPALPAAELAICCRPRCPSVQVFGQDRPHLLGEGEGGGMPNRKKHIKKSLILSRLPFFKINNNAMENNFFESNWALQIFDESQRFKLNAPEI